MILLGSDYDGTLSQGGREELKAVAETVFPTVDALICHLMEKSSQI